MKKNCFLKKTKWVFLTTLLLSALFVSAQKKNIESIGIDDNESLFVPGPTNGSMIPLNTYSGPSLSCVVDGIEITTSGSYFSFYDAPPSGSAICSPSAEFSGNNGSWTGGVSGTLTYTFSQPITSVSISYSAVDTEDTALISLDNAAPFQLLNACGADVNGAILASNCAYDSFGNVSVTVVSSVPFTAITATNISGDSGWVTGNPCNFIINPDIIQTPPKTAYLQVCYSPSSTTTVDSILAGVAINGEPATAANASISMVDNPLNLIMNDDGTLTVPGGTFDEDHISVFSYVICSNTGACTPEISSYIHIVSPVQPLPDTFSYVDGALPLIPYNVFSNDFKYMCPSFNNEPLNTSNAILTPIAPFISYFEIQLNGNVMPVGGSVTAPATEEYFYPGGFGIFSPSYKLYYQVCDANNPSVCKTSSVSIHVVVHNTNKISNHNNIKKNFVDTVIYPNPSNGVYTLDFQNDSSSDTLIEVFNTIGQKVFSDDSKNSNTYQLDISNLNTGNYLLKLSNSNQTVVKKITKL